MKQASDNLEFT